MPFVDPDSTTQASLLEAVQAQAAPVSTVNEPAPPTAVNSRCDGSKRKLQPGAGAGGGPGAGGGVGDGAGAGGGEGGDPLATCVSDSCWPATVRVAVRAPPGLACTLIWTAALPAPEAGDTTTQGASLDAVHRQALCALTLTRA